jgi:hypothetical protein
MCYLGPCLVRAGPRFRHSRIPSHSYRGSIRRQPKAPTAVALAAAPPTAVVLPNGPGRSCRPSRGSYPNRGWDPSPSPTGRPGTSDGDMRVQAKAPPGRCPRPVRERTNLGHQPPARSCRGEATVLFAFRYSCRQGFPLRTAPNLRRCGERQMRCYQLSFSYLTGMTQRHRLEEDPAARPYQTRIQSMSRSAGKLPAF